MLIPDASVSRYRGLVALDNFMHTCLLTIGFALSCRSWYVLFHVQDTFTEGSLHNSSLTSAGAGKNVLR